MTALRPHWSSRTGTRNGVRVLTGGPSELPRPDLEDGQVRCPGCGNATTTYLRNPRRLTQHRTLRGDMCGQRTIAVAVVLDELPPVDMGPRLRGAAARSHEAAEQATPRWDGTPAERRAYRRQADLAAGRTLGVGSRVGLYPNGTCHTDGCDTRVTGERIYCGMCVARRS